jgi:hypothetical protein
MFFFFAEQSPLEPSRSTSATSVVFLVAAGLPAPRRLITAPIRHGPASLTPPPPQYNLSFCPMVVGHVTQLGVSCSKEIRLEVCRSLHIYNRICFGLSMHFGQPADA